jgi:hypothetical protein
MLPCATSSNRQLHDHRINAGRHNPEKVCEKEAEGKRVPTPVTMKDREQDRSQKGWAENFDQNSLWRSHDDARVTLMTAEVGALFQPHCLLGLHSPLFLDNPLELAWVDNLPKQTTIGTGSKPLRDRQVGSEHRRELKTIGPEQLSDPDLICMSEVFAGYRSVSFALGALGFVCHFVPFSDFDWVKQRQSGHLGQP